MRCARWRAVGRVPIALEGIGELEQMVGHLGAMNVPGRALRLIWRWCAAWATTGPVYGRTSPKPDNLGSVTGGGRCDGLVGVSRQKPADTGSSLGIERIIDLLDLLNLYPPERRARWSGGVTVFGDAGCVAGWQQATRGGHRTEGDMTPRRAIGRQVQYANRGGAWLPFWVKTDQGRAG